MASIEKVLVKEITRLASKEAAKQVKPLQKDMDKLLDEYGI